LKKIGSILRIVLPLGLGIFLVWYVFSKLTPSDVEDIKQSFRSANYWWIGLSLLLGLLSHMSRAWRWKYTLKPINYYPKFYNSFFSVMIAYLVNLAIPRLGEVTRCTVMSRYENMKFNKLLGTVIAERVADLMILLSFMTVTLILQFDNVKHLLEGTFVETIMTNPVPLAATVIAGLAAAWLGLRLLRISQNNFIIKIRSFIEDVIEGLKSILTMKDRWLFILHTVLIWILYFGMFWVGFYSIPGLSDVPFEGVLAGFVLGGISIAATNGGIGAYPLAIQAILLLYNVDSNTGLAFGWIIWTAQTIMILLIGGASFILMPVLNKKKADELNTSHFE